MSLWPGCGRRDAADREMDDGDGNEIHSDGGEEGTARNETGGDGLGGNL